MQEKTNRMLNKVRYVANKHRKALAREYRKLIYKDQYGIIRDDRWMKLGVTYFIDNVLLEHFCSDEMPLFNDILNTIQTTVTEIASKACDEYRGKSCYHQQMSGVEYELL